METTDRHTEKARTFAHLAALLGADRPDERERRLRVVVGDGVLEQEAGQALVLTVARLLPRICERIAFDAPSADCVNRLRPLLAADAFSGESLAALARLIWDDGEFSPDRTTPVDATLGIGAPGDISLGIDATGAAVITHQGMATIERPDALEAALVAAAVGCSQLPNVLWPEVLGAVELGEVRLLDGPFGGPLEPDMPVELERPVFAGVGAVGCAALYAFIVLGATGRVLLLDPDVVSDSNLMRYILFDARHLGTTKVRAASEIIAATGLALDVELEKKVLQEYLKEHAEERERLELVVCAVDTYDARREIAGELPRQIVNAGTTPSDFTISRHGFGDGFACLACLYPPRKQDIEMTAVMARELGLAKAEVEQLRRTKKPLNKALLSHLAESRGHEPDHYLAYLGEPIDTVYNKVVCGEQPIETGRGEAVAPLAYGSALAGFLLARVAARPIGDHRHFRMDFISGLATPLRKSPRPRASCQYCGKAAARKVYEDRWGTES